MIRSRYRALVLVPAFAASASLIGLPAGGAPKPAARPTADFTEERGLFEAHCGICHLKDGYATSILAARLGPKRALLAVRQDLDANGIKSVVRGGVGGMPPQTRVDLADADLDRITAYLTRPRPERRQSRASPDE
jgi:mono/diheme cytochrome c family protein